MSRTIPPQRDTNYSLSSGSLRSKPEATRPTAVRHAPPRSVAERAAFVVSLIRKFIRPDSGDEDLPGLRRVLQSTAIGVHGIPDGYLSAQGRHLNTRPVSHTSPGLTPLEVANLRIGQKHQTSDSLRNSRIAESPIISVVLYGLSGIFIYRELALLLSPPLAIFISKCRIRNHFS